MTTKTAFRLATPDRWSQVMAEGRFTGDPHDVADGFIHLSAADQVEGTLIKHYNDHERLLLVEIDLTALGETVKWEKSRGGALFPHVYGEIPASAVRGLRHVRRNEEGDWILPSEHGEPLMSHDLATRLLHGLDPETAHRLGIQGLKLGLGPRQFSRDPDILHTRLAGLDLPNPVGLAAGFDKNAETPDALLAADFGFVECGAVTPPAQDGKPKPRIFRLEEDRAVINRMGFPNHGPDPFKAPLRPPVRSQGRGWGQSGCQSG